MTGGLETRGPSQSSREHELACDIFLVGSTAIVVAAAILSAIFF